MLYCGLRGRQERTFSVQENLLTMALVVALQETTGHLGIQKGAIPRCSTVHAMSIHLDREEKGRSASQAGQIGACSTGHGFSGNGGIGITANGTGCRRHRGIHVDGPRRLSHFASLK
jgi:hypothetical protein